MLELEERFNIGLKAIDSASSLALLKKSDEFIEKEIISIIHSKFPNDSILGEETGESQIKSEFKWVIDPIDGSKNYLNGLLIYGVSIALLHNGNSMFGIIKIPETNELFYRKKDLDMIYMPKNKKINFRSKENLIFISGSVENFESKAMIKILNSDKEKGYSCRILGSVTFSLMELLKDNCKIVILRNVKFWDIISALYILKGDNYFITDLKGNPWNERNTEMKDFIVTRNKDLHNRYLEVFRD